MGAHSEIGALLKKRAVACGVLGFIGGILLGSAYSRNVLDSVSLYSVRSHSAFNGAAAPTAWFSCGARYEL